MTLDDFATALVAGGFRPSTVANYTKAVASITAHPDGVKLHGTNVAAARAYLGWPQHDEIPAAREACKRLLDRVVEAQNTLAPKTRVGKRRATQARRLHEAKSLPDDDFARLYDAAWQSGSPEDTVIALLCVTGLRIGDVLRATYGAISTGAHSNVIELVTKGGERHLLAFSGAEIEWRRLLSHFPEGAGPKMTVATMLTGDPRASTLADAGAYTRVRRRLGDLSATVGISDRMHLHRLRRTVAVRALRATSDITSVQHLLGHRSIMTTSKYLDEARPEALAGLQQSIHPSQKRKGLTP